MPTLTWVGRSPDGGPGPPALPATAPLESRPWSQDQFLLCAPPAHRRGGGRGPERPLLCGSPILSQIGRPPESEASASQQPGEEALVPAPSQLLPPNCTGVKKQCSLWPQRATDLQFHSVCAGGPVRRAKGGGRALF